MRWRASVATPPPREAPRRSEGSTSASSPLTGSLTTPPCTEGVTWLVLKSPSQISKDQVAAFAKKYPHNARPVQPLNGRVVQATR